MRTEAFFKPRRERRKCQARNGSCIGGKKKSISPPDDLRVLDIAKGILILLVFNNHLVESVFGGAFFFNPEQRWPSMGLQLAQLLTPAGPGMAGVIGTTIRDIGWLSEELLGLFLVLSGFGLGWGLARARIFDLRTYISRRLGRIYPMWLTAHAMIAGPLVVAGKVSWIIALASAIGIRFLPSTYFAIVPAWWYIGLLLQLYAIVPILWWACRRFGAAQMIVGAVVLGLTIRGIGWSFAGQYIDEWSRGSIFVTRLPEFGFGFGLAVLCHADVARFKAVILDLRVVCAGGAAFVIGNVGALTWIGMVFAPLLISFGAFVLVSSAFARARLPILEWLGRHSYALYLMHQVTILLFMRHLHSPKQIVLGASLALVTGVLLALLLEKLTAWFVSWSTPVESWRVGASSKAA
ncbi:MAG: acyltransferase [Candidatus Velthaea sp.]